MKKVFLSFAFVAILFACSFERVLSDDCPPGQVNKARHFGPDANGCDWDVSFCVACAVTHLDVTLLKVLEITPTNGCELADLDQSWLLAQLKIFLINYCSKIKECGNGACTRMSIQLPLCYKWHSVGWVDNNNVTKFATWLEYCKDDSYCEVNFGVCMNYSTTPPTVGPCLPTTKIPRNSTCKAGEIAKPTAPYTGWVGESYSACFEHGCW